MSSANLEVVDLHAAGHRADRWAGSGCRPRVAEHFGALSSIVIEFDRNRKIQDHRDKTLEKGK